MELDLHPAEDWLHPLEARQYEALYFAFTSQDGEWFGFVRLLLGAKQVLELVALATEGEQWGLTHAFPRATLHVEKRSLVAPHLRMHLVEGWQRWDIAFTGELSRLSDGEKRPFSLEATFMAESKAARYRLGAYQQGEQEGTLEGKLTLGKQQGPTRYLTYRDHSWGVRDLERLPSGWKVATVPGRLYLVCLHLNPDIVFGRIESQNGPKPLIHAEVEPLEEGILRYSLPDFDMEIISRPLAAPLSVYLGKGGVEAVRTYPEREDLWHDTLGPVLYTLTGPTGSEQVLGFLEEARRLI